MNINRLSAITLLMAITTSLGIISCRMDDQQASAPTVEQLTPSQDEVITFTIEAPKGLPTTYAEERIQDEEEWYISDNTIEIFEFLASNKKFLQRHRLKLTPVSGQPRYTGEMKVSDFLGEDGSKHPGENRVLVFIANRRIGNTDIVVNNVKTVSDFYSMRLLEMRSYDTNKGPLTMVGEAQSDGSESFGPDNQRYEGNSQVPIVGGSHIKVDLIRAVARIDVRVTMTQSLSHMTYKRLVVRDLSLENAPYESTIGERKELPDGAAKIGFASSFWSVTKIPSGGLTPEYDQCNGVPGLLTKAFYIYETPHVNNVKQDSEGGTAYYRPKEIKDTLDENAKCPILEVQVDYGDDYISPDNNPNGGRRYLYIPFTDEDGKDIPIKRNHIYTVVIGPNELENEIQGVHYKIIVNDWERQVDITKALELIYPQLDSQKIDGLDAARHTLSVQAAGVEKVEIPFASNFKAGASETFEASILEIKDRQGKPVDQSWISASFEGNKLAIKVQKNETAGERSAVIVVKGKSSDDAYTYQLKVTQEGKTK